MTRSVRAIVTLTAAVALGIPLAGSAAADIDQDTTCTETVACVPVTAPIDVRDLLSLDGVLDFGLPGERIPR